MDGTPPLLCLVISDGRRGIENQALGLALAVSNLRPMVVNTHIVAPAGLLKAAGSGLQLALKSRPEDYGLTTPFPQIAIGCGRQAIAPLRALKKMCGADIFTVYVQDPRIDPKHFDLVIAPQHDKLRGDNVETMIGSPNKVSNDRIIVDTLKFSQKLAALPAPRAAILIGGNSKSHTLTPACHTRHIQTVKELMDKNMSVMITTSRRTPEFAKTAYRALTQKHDTVWYVDDQGENPYFAFLGGADIILVTEDSTNMLTESCVTGKPVFTLPMEGKAGKFAKLYEALAKNCHVGPFTGSVDGKPYSPLNETARMAETLLRRYDNK